MADLSSLEKQIREGFKVTNERLNSRGERFDALEKQIDVLAQATAKGFDSVNGRLDVLETDVKDVKENLGVVNQKLERIERRLDEHGEIVIGLDTRVGRLEKTEEPVV